MAADEVVEVENWVQERVLGSGGFGTVTLWRNKTTSDLIALKKCRTGTDVLLTPKHKERWAKEVDIMKRLDHPNVVKSVEVPLDLAGLRSELPLMCMEFCSKGDLRQVLNKSENCCGLQENDARALISDVKSAVQYLHLMKITHRDLKPENIVLQETDNKIVYKLIDLGYAKELDQSSICTSFVGTLQYLAPELFMSKKYTCSVDYWSLGLLSHEVITGVRPFLPNMSPAAWMTHVKDKSSDHICAYQDLDGSVIFSTELCHQNHISSTLKYHLEQWLKLLLEWDPAKRGRVAGKNDIVVFDLIEEILNKKVVTVFCVPAFKYLSYEIDDSTAVTTLQRWIERDTDLPVASQELMLPTGQPVDMEKEACQCLVSTHNQNGAMLYVYKQGSLKVEHDAPRVPPFVAKMLEEPKGLMEYIHQKRTWAHAVFFLQQELQLFTALLLAYKIKLHNLIINSTKLNQQSHSVVSQLHEAMARFSLSSDSLSFDEEHAKKYACFSTKMAFWKKVNSGMTMKMNKLKLLVKQLEAKCGSVQQKTLELQRNSHLNAASYDALISYVESGLKCYENLRRRPKEIRQRKTNNLEMARIVYHCLKERFIFLKDEPSLAYLNQLLGVQSEIKQLWSPLSKTQIEINKAIAEIKQAQLERQHSVWEEIAPPEQCNGILPVSRGKSPVFTVPSLVASSIIDPELPLSSSPAPSLRHMSPEPSQCTPVDDSQQQSLMDSMCGVPNANVDTSTMINHNKHLRYMTQDLLTESFQQHVKLLEEGTSLDWTFLNAQEEQ